MNNVEQRLAGNINSFASLLTLRFFLDSARDGLEEPLGLGRRPEELREPLLPAEREPVVDVPDVRERDARVRQGLLVVGRTS